MSQSKESFGSMTNERWQELGDQMLKMKLIKKVPESF